jgi:hypothetical protein
LSAGQIIVRSTTISRSDSTTVENSAPPSTVAGSSVVRRRLGTVTCDVVTLPSAFWNS